MPANSLPTDHDELKDFVWILDNLEKQTDPRMGALSQEGPLVIYYTQEEPKDHPIVKQIETARNEKAEFRKSDSLRDGAWDDFVLFQVPLHFSEINNCILIECSLFQCKTTSSQLKNCSIGARELAGTKESGTRSTLRFSQLEGGTLHDAHIEGSTLNGVDANASEIVNSLVANSYILESTLQECGVATSVLHNCDVSKGFFKYYRKPNRPEDPPEDDVPEVATVQRIRQESTSPENHIIHIHSYRTEFRNRIPSKKVKMEKTKSGLVANLPPEPVLYKEALDLLFRQHVLVITRINISEIAEMPKAVVQRVRKLCIDLTAGSRFHTSEVWEYFPASTAITEIKIRLPTQILRLDQFSDVTKLWFRYFGTVTKFTVVWSKDPHQDTRDIVFSEPPPSLMEAVTNTSKCLGIESELVRSENDPKGRKTWKWDEPPDFATYMWTWCAGENEVLVWKTSDA